MGGAVETFALWGGAALTFSGLVYGGFKFYRWFDKLSRLMQHELNHNSGSSIKDHSRKAAEESIITNVLLKEALDKIENNTKEIRAARRDHREFYSDQMAWNEATERELDRAWSMLGKRGPTDGTSDEER